MFRSKSFAMISFYKWTLVSILVLVDVSLEGREISRIFRLIAIKSRKFLK